MSRVLARCLMLLAAIACGSGNYAHAADWLDDLPSVPQVVDTVREYVEEARQKNPNLVGDDDFLANYLVGTFLLVRWFIWLQATHHEPVRGERATRLRSIIHDYMQAELVIGEGLGRRKGHIASGCQRKDTYLNRFGRKMFATLEECYRWVFSRDIGIYPSFEYRKVVMPKLFCARGQLYHERLQAVILKMPVPEASPSETRAMPDGVRALGPAFCSPYGGDTNRNGLCDEWEKPLSVSIASGAATAGCTPEATGKLEKAIAGGLRLELADSLVPAGKPFNVRVVSAASRAADSGAPLAWAGTAYFSPVPSAPGRAEAFLATNVAFKPDPQRPFLVAQVSGARRIATASCEVALDKWLPSQLSPKFSGFHGPYPKIEDAVKSNGAVALNATTSNREAGFLVLRQKSSGQFYATTPLTGGSSKESYQVVSATFEPADYKRSVLTAFEGSCESLAAFEVAATVHTHPNSTDLPFLGFGSGAFRSRTETFSLGDYEHTIGLLAPVLVFDGLEMNAAIQSIYMLSASSRCLYAVVPDAADPPLSDLDRVLSVWGLLPANLTAYKTFLARQRGLGCYTK